jgi:hypothetical protein
MTRHRVHVVYDREHPDDLAELDEFFRRFGDAADYVTRDGALSSDLDPAGIRARWFPDAVVTLVLNGTCTLAKRDVDWELQAALEPGDDGLPNGLLAVTIDLSAQKYETPRRVEENIASGYARLYRYPLSAAELGSWFDDALDARTHRRHLLVNPPGRLDADLDCDPGPIDPTGTYPLLQS